MPIHRRPGFEAIGEMLDPRRIAGEIDAHRIEADEGVRELLPGEQSSRETHESASLAGVDPKVGRSPEHAAGLHLDDGEGRWIAVSIGRDHRHEIRLVGTKAQIAGDDREPQRFEMRRGKRFAEIRVAIGSIRRGGRGGSSPTELAPRESLQARGDGCDRPTMRCGHGRPVGTGERRAASRSRAIRSSRSDADEVS